MSWWFAEGQLDEFQRAAVIMEPHQASFVLVGPPGSGKTNVLLRRAQYLSLQGHTNFQVLCFERPLVEFIKTGCTVAGVDVAPLNAVSTIRQWVTSLLADSDLAYPEDKNPESARRNAAIAALQAWPTSNRPTYDLMYVDEAQDLLLEEGELIKAASEAVVWAGDPCQRIFIRDPNLLANLIQGATEVLLPNHYRISPAVCAVADKIMTPSAGGTHASSGLNVEEAYTHAICHPCAGPDDQVKTLIQTLSEELRYFEGLLMGGNRIGVVVQTREQRAELVHRLVSEPELAGHVKELRARTGQGDAYSPTIEDEDWILVLTSAGVKGLEFLSVHWMYCESINRRAKREEIYTVVTRAKFSLDVYHSGALTSILSSAMPNTSRTMWGDDAKD